MAGYIYGVITLLLMGYSLAVKASDASEAITKQRLQFSVDALLMLPHQEGDVVRTAVLHTTPQQLAALCDTPALSLAGKDTRLTGRRTLVARCGARKHFFPLRIKAEGTWWVARNTLPAGTVIQPDDIVPYRGNLESQPAGVQFIANAIIGQYLIRPVEAGQPLLQNQLRQQRLLRAGQTVVMVTSGEGFLIRRKGKVLTHASVNDTVKVQTANGKTVTGKVMADGQVQVPLTQ